MEYRHKNYIYCRERTLYSHFSCSVPQAQVSLNLSSLLMSGSSKTWWHPTSAYCYTRLICGWAESWAQFSLKLLMPELICQSLNWLSPRCKAMYYQLWNDSFFWILLTMNLAVKEGWLVSSSLHQVQSFAHSSIQTGKWLTCHFSFTNSC